MFLSRVVLTYTSTSNPRHPTPTFSICRKNCDLTFPQSSDVLFIYLHQLFIGFQIHYAFYRVFPSPLRSLSVPDPTRVLVGWSPYKPLRCCPCHRSFTLVGTGTFSDTIVTVFPIFPHSSSPTCSTFDTSTAHPRENIPPCWQGLDYRTTPSRRIRLQTSNLD